MLNLEQDVLCVLLRLLKDEEVISQELHDQAKCRILDTPDWPEFFCCGEEKLHGSA